MGFDLRDIRPAMDVYTLDNTYLGTVEAIIPGPVAPSAGTVAGERADDDQAPSEGSSEPGSAIDGERLGPAPTQGLGNAGPDRQSARTRYATAADDARPIGRGHLRVSRWWGLVGRRTIPLEMVQTVSMERVVLRVKAEAINGLSSTRTSPADHLPTASRP